jgi:preprotein translocase subunit SecF
MRWLHRVNYMKDAKYWIVFSIVLTLAGLITFGVMGLNKGIDFTGGMRFDFKFEKTVSQAEVASVVEKAIGSNDVSIQTAEVKGQATGGDEFFVRTPDLNNDQRTKMLGDLKGLSNYEKVSEEQVSATVSGELTRQAILAVIIAAILQIVYLWFRFELKFGVTAVVALLHDTLITIGVVSLLRIQINSPFVAAILTILGYSINDTVIVFDRIRENLQHRKKGESLADLTTRSIQETITRSIYTVLTVEICLLSLVFFGGDTIRDFVMTLVVGITSGMYSSIFIAAALWVYWQEWEDRRHKTAPKKAKPARA